MCFLLLKGLALTLRDMAPPPPVHPPPPTTFSHGPSSFNRTKTMEEVSSLPPHYTQNKNNVAMFVNHKISSNRN